VGAPISDTAGKVTAALGVSGTLTPLDEEDLSKIVEALKETARRISRELMSSGVAGAV
jgi:DNA-binding IclR family transcriptional regulator